MGAFQDPGREGSAELAVDDPEVIVSFDEVVAVIGGFPVLAGASLCVRTGDIVLLSGPNGAGKTSLLRVCAGLLPISRGSATVCGIDLVADRQSVASSVGLLGHANGLYRDLTVAENVSFWGATVGASDREVTDALVRLGLDGRLRDVAVRRLSAGQRRRTALACLIVRRARLWLLDEPHSTLDADGRDELDRLLREAAASGATIILASHELERAGSVATRTVVVTGGRLHESGATGDSLSAEGRGGSGS